MLYFNSPPQNLDELMYDDYDFDYSSGNDFELDESVFQHDSDDEDYSRDSHDYQDLAYRHYA
jgi:hypothetical protein